MSPYTCQQMCDLILTAKPFFANMCASSLRFRAFTTKPFIDKVSVAESERDREKASTTATRVSDRVRALTGGKQSHVVVERSRAAVSAASPAAFGCALLSDSAFGTIAIRRIVSP